MQNITTVVLMAESFKERTCRSVYYFSARYCKTKLTTLLILQLYIGYTSKLVTISSKSECATGWC